MQGLFVLILLALRQCIRKLHKLISVLNGYFVVFLKAP